MHLVCTKENLLKGFQAVSKAVASKSLLPILGNVLFECTEDNKLKLSATDLEISVETYVDSTVLSTGKITIPARALNDIISKLPNSDIELTTNDSLTETLLKCSKSNFNIKSIQADEFPSLPKVTTDDCIFIPSTLLANSIKKTIFAASTDTTKNVLNGVRFQFNAGKVEMASTDGYRLAVNKITIESDNEQGFGVIVPSKAMNELSRLLGSVKEETTVTVSHLSNQLVFKIDEKTISTRLVEGQYPDYNRIIPNNLDKHVIINREEFLSAVDRVSSISSIDKVNVVKLDITSGQVVLSSSTPELGQSTESVDVDYQGDSLEINFNAKFFMEALKNFDSEKVSLSLAGSLNPGIIKSLDDENYFCMVMPIRS